MDSRIRVLLLIVLATSVIQMCVGRPEMNLNVATNIVESLKLLSEEEIKTVDVNYTLLNPVTENLQLAACVSVEDADIALIIHSSRNSQLVNLRKQPTGHFTFSVKGLFLGRTFIHLRFVLAEPNVQLPCQVLNVEKIPYNLISHFNLTSEFLPDELTSVSFEGHCETVVTKRHGTADVVFNVGIVLLIIVVNLGIGCKVDLAVVKEEMRRPVGPATGFCAQFIIMPLISYGAARLFKFGPALALGFFALGCSPGGSASNAYTMLLDGDVSLSITMTFISTVAALGMVPLWLLTLGPTLYSGTSIKIPYQNILYSLVGLLIPVGIGLLIQYKRPRWAVTLIKVSKVVMVIFLIFVLTLGIYTNLYIFRVITLSVLGASATLPYLGFFLGGLMAFLCRMPRKQVLTVAIETGIQNTGIAIVLLLLSLHPPESNISIVAPIMSAMFTPLPLWVAIAVVHGRRRFCRKGGDRESDIDKEAREAMKSQEDGKNEENGSAAEQMDSLFLMKGKNDPSDSGKG